MEESGAEWSSVERAELERVLRARAGLVFQPGRRDALESAATRVMRRAGIRSPTMLLALAQQDGAVFDDLSAEVTVGETYFFREAAHFALLRDRIIPDFRQQHRHDEARTFRAWSAGCSTGEEPYSIAIALRESGASSAVVGTDISRARLSAARRARYRPWSFRGVPEPVIDRWFTKRDDGLLLAPEIRRAVELRYLNLAADAFPSLATGVWGMDLIFCRNVLIYFDRDTTARVAELLFATMADDGWLVTGATDPALAEFARCEVIQTPAGLVYRPRRGGRVPARRSEVAAARRVLPPPPPGEAGSGISPAKGGEAKAPPIERPHDRAAPDANQSPALSPPADTPAGTYAARNYERTVALLAPAAGSGDIGVRDAVLYIRALANLGRLAEAGRACAAALDRHRDDAELHYLHAVFVAHAGQVAESARAARRALYLDRSMIVAHIALGDALARAGELPGARRAFAAAERLLHALPADGAVLAADGESAGRLLDMTRVHARLSTRGDEPRAST